MMMKKKTYHKHILSYQTEFPRAAISQHDNIVGYVSEEKNIELSILDSEHFEHAETERSRDTRLPERCICYSKNQTKKKNTQLLASLTRHKTNAEKFIFGQVSGAAPAVPPNGKFISFIFLEVLFQQYVNYVLCSRNGFRYVGLFNKSI